MNKLLISTMLKFVLYDKKPIVLHEGDLSLGTAHYDGITWNNNDVFLSATIDTKYIVHKFDKSFQLIDTLAGANLHETHQIFWQDEKLYVLNTGLNRVEILEGNKWRSVAWKHAEYDIDHINGLWSDGKQFYFSEFRNRTEDKPPSAIRICDLELNSIDEILINVSTGIHNVYREKGILYTLIADIPRIVMYNLEAKKLDMVKLDISDSPVWVRGLARTRNFWYIGISRWETERDKRHVGDAIVLQLDNNFKETNRIIMPDFGPVCDIRVIDDLDLAHNGVCF